MIFLWIPIAGLFNIYWNHIQILSLAGSREHEFAIANGYDNDEW